MQVGQLLPQVPSPSQPRCSQRGEEMGLRTPARAGVWSSRATDARLDVRTVKQEAHPMIKMAVYECCRKFFHPETAILHEKDSSFANPTKNFRGLSRGIVAARTRDSLSHPLHRFPCSSFRHPLLLSLHIFPIRSTILYAEAHPWHRTGTNKKPDNPEQLQTHEVRKKPGSTCLIPETRFVCRSSEVRLPTFKTWLRSFGGRSEVVLRSFQARSSTAHIADGGEWNGCDFRESFAKKKISFANSTRIFRDRPL